MLENEWKNFLEEEKNKEYFKELKLFLKEEYKNKKIYPKAKEILNALELTPFLNVKVVILGQDPYHQINQAHGLAFSVQKGVKTPPSLKNIYKEISENFNCKINIGGDLTNWAKQGVLLLNTILTVEDSKPLSHKNKGWEIFTDEIIKMLNKKEEPVVFLLWGSNSKMKKELITNHKHLILEAAHPSPLSAYNGFFGCNHFSLTNDFLKKHNLKEIDWQIS